MFEYYLLRMKHSAHPGHKFTLGLEQFDLSNSQKPFETGSVAYKKQVEIPPVETSNGGA